MRIKINSMVNNKKNCTLFCTMHITKISFHAQEQLNNTLTTRTCDEKAIRPQEQIHGMTHQ